MTNFLPIADEDARSDGRDDALDFEPAYQPDDTAQVRALLLIAGLPAEEIERVVAEMNLDSDREM